MHVHVRVCERACERERVRARVWSKESTIVGTAQVARAHKHKSMHTAQASRTESWVVDDRGVWPRFFFWQEAAEASRGRVWLVAPQHHLSTIHLTATLHPRGDGSRRGTREHLDGRRWGLSLQLFHNDIHLRARGVYQIATTCSTATFECCSTLEKNRTRAQAQALGDERMRPRMQSGTEAQIHMLIHESHPPVHTHASSPVRYSQEFWRLRVIC